jgi:hypothetical protein
MLNAELPQLSRGAFDRIVLFWLWLINSNSYFEKWLRIEGK